MQAVSIKIFFKKKTENKMVIVLHLKTKIFKGIFITCDKYFI